MKGKDRDTRRGISRSLKTAFEPERASIEQFDDLIAKLAATPGSSRGGSSSPAAAPHN